MKAFVTGGAGYIGSHTVVELLAAGYDVIVADNLSNSSEEAIRRVEKIAGKKVKFYKADVCDKAAVRRIFEENEIDIVLHFAGLKAVGESVEKPVAYYRNNIDCTLTLLEVMKEKGVKKFIFSSSATVYGDPAKLPVTEDFPLSTTNPYGTTKLFIERILSDATFADKEMSVVLLRYFNPIGAHESGLIGEDPKGIPNNLAPYIAKVAIGELPFIRVFGNDYPTKDGTGVRDYIHVVDLAKGHVAAIPKLEEAGVHIYNLGTGNGYSVLEVIAAFEKACGHPLKKVMAPRRGGDIAACFASADKAKRELGWEAKLTIDDMCESLWNFRSKNPNGYGA